MTPMVPLVMFGWLPLAVLLFARMQARHAVIAGFLLAWMFLPQYTYTITGLPNYNKVSAMSYGILLGTLIFNSRVLTRFQPHVGDIPMLLWCVIPFFSSISNGLGAYDGASMILRRVTLWGLPYFIGRLYFHDRESLAELAFGIFLGGLIYMPFCLYEVVMSPRLHRIVYGFHPHHFGQSKRGGGWRPVVFMQHGLMTAMWMVTAWLSGYQLWRTGWLHTHFPKWKKIWTPAVGALLITVILCKSTGALGLMALGVLILHTIHKQWRFPLRILLILPVLYVLARGGGFWDGQNLIDLVARITSAERTQSLEFRLNNETILAEKAKERFMLGWGEWGRSFVRDDEGRPLSVPDGLWILAFGQNGALGLAALLLTLMMPPTLFLRMYPPHRWRDPPVAAIAAGPLLIALFTLDSLFNDMFNPLIMILAGGLTALWIAGDTAEVSMRTLIPETAGGIRTRLW